MLRHDPHRSLAKSHADPWLRSTPGRRETC